MSVFNVHEAKTNLSSLLERALAGEEVVIAKAGKPLVRLQPLAKPEPRRPGLAKGRLTKDFFEPLPPEELSAWEQ